MPEMNEQSVLGQRADISPERLTECLADALEVMAFIGILPCETPAPPPLEAKAISIRFAGPFTGRMELVVDDALGGQLAANVLGLEAFDAAAMQRAGDAAAELANVICGSLLGRVDGGNFEMGLPAVRPFEATEWDGFITSPNACVVDAEGTSLAVRVVTPA